ncbi:MAG: hypothetical protein QOD77_93 [Thermoplasmata archaeon]|jgi:hypothetical protein|nr:hypothetical protein [Thermoplasmata archaeon]
MRVASAALLLAACALLPATDGTVCTSPADCRFWDGDYHQEIMYEVDTAQVDVLVAGVQDLATIRLALDSWEAGIRSFASPLLNAGFDLRPRLATDPPAASDPEILVLEGAVNPVLLFGIGLQTPLGPCLAQDGAHSHDGSSWMAVQATCDFGGKVCLVVSTNFLLGGAIVTHDLFSHELGHCLGLGEVGGESGFHARTVPLNDIMAGPRSSPAHVACVSNLNVLGLEAIYAKEVGNPGAWLPAGSFVSMPPSAYRQYACPNP